MKKIFNYSFLFIVAILSISCTKDTGSPSLSGKWHFTADGSKGSGTTIIWTPSTNSSNVCGLQDYMEFSSNGTLSTQEYVMNPSTGACELYVDFNPTSHSETWVRTGDDVTITNNDFTTTPTTVSTFKAHIMTLTDSELIVQEYDFANFNLIDSYSKFTRK
jgi:hypothetical protein